MLLSLSTVLLGFMYAITFNDSLFLINFPIGGRFEGYPLTAFIMVICHRN